MRRALLARLERLRANVKLFASAKAFRLLEHRVLSERQLLDGQRERILRAAKAGSGNAGATLNEMRAKLAALDPGAVLERGYALITDRKGAALTGIDMLSPGDDVQIRLRDGTADAVIERLERLGTK